MWRDHICWTGGGFHLNNDILMCFKMRKEEVRDLLRLVLFINFLTVQHSSHFLTVQHSSHSLCFNKLSQNTYNSTGSSPEHSACMSPQSVSPQVAFNRSLHASYWNKTQVFVILCLTYLSTAHLLSLSPTAELAETCPHCHIPLPHSWKGSHPQRPDLWTTLNLKGCNARYQQVIRVLLSFMH